ncbi:YkvA family protein [Nocardiopsis kunsanensis]|uniref:DUF1232 domain-containing protein n=1 Tax=Nocardiopsis kunsanensis TaxID=141693 RepID=A0A918XBD0_9ACTN|nr:DUF1232 domain-containing protein [Nocardiopsis kunsanensis]GHD21674.1 hypothetical protein GCM10007147_15370 [Nocardiopsis kunsanensis]
MRKYNRAAAGAAAWQVIQNTGGRVSVWQRALAVPRMLGAKLRGRYPELSSGKLLAMLVMAGYILSPVDFVPELLFSVFGLVDDIGVAVWLTTMLLGESERYVEWERDAAAQQATYTEQGEPYRGQARSGSTHQGVYTESGAAGRR